MDGNRRIDVMVATRVMGYELHERLGLWYLPGTNATLADGKCVRQWSPSTDIAVAWEVVRHLKSNGERLHFDDFTNRYCASFSNGVHDWKRNYEHASEAMAICGAALKAVGTTHDEIESALEAQ